MTRSSPAYSSNKSRSLSPGCFTDYSHQHTVHTNTATSSSLTYLWVVIPSWTWECNIQKLVICSTIRIRTLQQTRTVESSCSIQATSLTLLISLSHISPITGNRSACLSVCLYVHLHISKTTRPNFTKFS